MVDRLVTFGAEGAEGPPGSVNVPGGRGILGFAGGNVFGVPESTTPGDVLTVGPSGAFAFLPITRLPTPAGAPDAGKVVTWSGSAYALTALPSQIPAGGPGVVGKNLAGDAVLFPFAAAPEGAFARRVGNTLGFSQLFNSDGYVKAAAGGGFSYVTIGTGLQEISGVLSVDPDTGILVTASGVATDPSAVAMLASGKITAANSRGRVMREPGPTPVKNSTNIVVAVSGAVYTLLASIALGTCFTGDQIRAIAKMNAGGTGSQHILRMRITNSASPDLNVTAGASVYYDTLEYFEPAAGGTHRMDVQYTVASGAALYCYLLARSSTATFNVTDKEMSADVFVL